MNTADIASTDTAASPAHVKATPTRRATEPGKMTRTRASKPAAKPVATKVASKEPAKQTAKASPAPEAQITAKVLNTAVTPKSPQAKDGKPVKDKKVKVVRDSFSIPKAELAQINDMKKRAMSMGISVKKSELIRAGLQALTCMTDTGFKKALASVPAIKTGRPAKD